MKLLCVHAHCDDYEFTAAGTFELARGRDPGGRRRVIICTDGAAGHHALTREATARRRCEEQEASARLGGFEFELLRDAEGRPFREGRLHASAGFLPALWQAIRAFGPDYLFCPPLPVDPLAGVHVDHLDVAQGVRSVAYLLNVPHAFTPEYPAEETHSVPVRTPVILNTYDPYLAAGHRHDVAVEVTGVTDRLADMAWCHASQLREWLPWVDRHNLEAPEGPEAWRRQFAARLERRRDALGLDVSGVFEFFQVTAWGAVPTVAQLRGDFPEIAPAASFLDALEGRLREWQRIAGQ